MELRHIVKFPIALVETKIRVFAEIDEEANVNYEVYDEYIGEIKKSKFDYRGEMTFEELFKQINDEKLDICFNEKSRILNRRDFDIKRKEARYYASLIY